MDREAPHFNPQSKLDYITIHDLQGFKLFPPLTNVCGSGAMVSNTQNCVCYTTRRLCPGQV